jgi:hypothetical protein
VVGSVGHLLARRRGRGRSWLASVTTFPALLVTLLLLVLSAAGRATQHQEALNKTAPDPTGSLVQREKAYLDAHAWSQSRAPVERAIGATLARAPGLDKAFITKGNTPAVRQTAANIKREFVQEQADWRALPPAPLRDLQQLDGQVTNALSLAASAYTAYATGFKANLASGLPFVQDKRARALLDRGDAKLNSATRILQAFGKQLGVVNQRYAIR